ncbi:hypothetical protein [Limosilactobacillus kribbianus]|uniref:hypothetical protein n=1 Tax=Limosilactobacillus kribbianus TaxID=2982695 RepID=UPI0022654763|nr:hypothetical protein [Limosilactobacillus kribbianus]
MKEKLKKHRDGVQEHLAVWLVLTICLWIVKAFVGWAFLQYVVWLSAAYSFFLALVWLYLEWRILRHSA